MNTMMRLFYAFLLAWTRLDLLIARSSPTINIKHIEQLRRDEDTYDRAMLRLELDL